MPEYCTCGAQLPPDALFCHKCGKPQRELTVPEPVVEDVVAFLPTPAAPPPQALPLTFRNPILVRIALVVSLGATVLSFLPFVNWIAAGFLSVFFYSRKTKSLLSVRAGVRLGWITGLLMFGLWTIVFTIQQVPAAMSGKLGTVLEDSMRGLPANDPAVQQMIAFFQTGAGMATVLGVLLVISFVFITGLSMAGAALCAKMVGRSD